jgi:predicted RNA binding protein YcfA (HicA-like mRNA interferase family)
MKYSELWKLLKAAGWKQGHGKKHDYAVHPENPKYKIIVPRHKSEVPSGTAEAILEAAGLKKQP